MTNVVYFVQRTDGLIKIGFSTNIHRRIIELRSAFGDLRLLVSIPGNRRLERHFHDELHSHHVTGEWFAPTSEVMAVVERLKAGDSPRLAPPDPQGQRQALEDGIAAVCCEFVKGIAWPRGIDETIPEAIKRVATLTTLTEREVKSIWYGEIKVVSAFAHQRLSLEFARRFENLTVLRA